MFCKQMFSCHETVCYEQLLPGGEDEDAHVQAVVPVSEDMVLCCCIRRDIGDPTNGQPIKGVCLLCICSTGLGTDFRTRATVTTSRRHGRSTIAIAIVVLLCAGLELCQLCNRFRALL